MKDKPIRSVLLFLLLYPIVLGANIREELGAIVKATTNKGEGILAKVDTVLMRNWKAAGMKFRFHRSIMGANNYKVLNEKWGTYEIFDVATPGTWYEYKVEVIAKEGDTFFLIPTTPVVGYRPPAGTFPTYFDMERLSQDENYLYINTHFKDANGNSVFSDDAIIHIRVKEGLPWYESQGVTQKYQDIESKTRNPNLRIKKQAGAAEVEASFMLEKNDSISNFHHRKIDLRTVPFRKPKIKVRPKIKKGPVVKNRTKGGVAPLFVMSNYSKFKTPTELPLDRFAIPFCFDAIRRQSQKQRIIRRVS